MVTNEKNNNIFVIHNGNYYLFPVIDSDGNIFEPDEILACFHHILKLNHPEPEYALGCLTAENRDTWAEVREHLEKIGNKEALELIDTSLYCIALDNIKSNDPDELSANFLHGNHKNRWFDKNHTLIITRNGQAAINFEHSWGDGVAVLRFFNEVRFFIPIFILSAKLIKLKFNRNLMIQPIDHMLHVVRCHLCITVR